MVFFTQHRTPDLSTQGVRHLYDLFIMDALATEGVGIADVWPCPDACYWTGQWGPSLAAYLDTSPPALFLSGRLDWEDALVMEAYERVVRACRRRRVPVGVVWTDLVVPGEVVMAEQMLDWVDLHVTFDRPGPPPETRYPARFCSLWPTPDRRWFYPTRDERPIPVSFVGETQDRPERQYFLNAVQQAGLPLFLAGEQSVRHHRLSTAEYAHVMQHSKIGISITSHPTRPQMKGRVLELLACETLLMEQENDSTAAHFTAMQDYVPYTTPQDLVDRIRYYLAHEAESRTIAEHGHATYRAGYTPAHFWHRVFAHTYGQDWRVQLEYL